MPGNVYAQRQALKSYVNSQADWRDRKAEEYPDDRRNRTAADNLRDFAISLDQLDDGHRLWALLTDELVAEPGLMVLGEEANSVLGNIDIGRDFLALADRLADAIERDQLNLLDDDASRPS